MRSLATLTAAGLPAWYTRECLAGQEEGRTRRGKGLASDRIVMAAIGVGTNYVRQPDQPLRGERGVDIMRHAMGRPDVQMVAVCDVDRHNRAFAADMVNGHNRNSDCRQYEDFRELLQDRDIDAVTIGTPDHWHALIAIAAMRAGKDVYCEKPLTLTLAEGRAMVRVARETDRVVQTGSQQRSEFDGRFRLACELIRNGRVGRVRRIETIVGHNYTGGPFPVTEPPEGLDWDFWLGPTPRVDYVRERCHYNFRWWYEYSGGRMTDWGAHHNDIAQWALGMDGGGPMAVEVVRAEEPSRAPNSYNVHPSFEVRFTYADGGSEGTRLVCRSTPSREGLGPEGVLFEGDDGKWLFVSRSRLIASRQGLIDEPLPRDATRLEVVTNGHMGNFLDCVRSRRRPICDVEIGHRSVSLCHLGTIALRSGRRLRWGPERERFLGDDEANRMLSREMRPPWAAEWRRLTADG